MMGHHQAHVFYLLRNIPEQVSTNFGLEGRILMGFVLAPFSQLKHDPKTHLMGVLGQRPVILPVQKD
jgi:hypothetical protein